MSKKHTPNYSDVATLIADTVPSEQVEIQEANARLIAAAPDLLALAKMIVNAQWSPEEEWPEVFDAAWDAISKVEGEAS